LDKKELTIVIHGLRNDKKSANSKFVLVKNRLRRIGYKFPVVGFTYDSNTKGAHLKKYVVKSLHVGQIIAEKNGTNLSRFILDYKKTHPEVKIRLIGHSLGSEVIFYTLKNLAKNKNSKNIVESVYFFGASIPDKTFSTKKHRKLFEDVIRKKIINYYAPSDEVLYSAQGHNLIDMPLGLNGTSGTLIPKFHNKMVAPDNHRFASYVKCLNSFP